ncbi:glycosyl transferase family 1 [Phyllobacterium leguminum]|uniref:Succinoglycan biosynthesis protein ExoL n=1 Tax=Phyllobacterium leguminum TaxID=314237 RepID=A0A318T6D3_9HYPH|nr:glycosyl transferase family 1 [Phyllobacterium leguminum]PYE88804.1 succinoglycan biosynthesis protein ExoL [Phyllobacterium leguminum]
MLQVLYLVHDLSDPAVRRRVVMLQAGGAVVTLVGFRRSGEPVSDVASISPIDLGKTSDGRFAQRLAAIAQATLTLGTALKRVAKPDVIIGRNLEMLALANRARAIFSGGVPASDRRELKGGADEVPIVYECLDVHRLLLRRDLAGKAIRSAERALARNAALLITSSPAFIRQYFEPFGQLDLPVELVENKVLELLPCPPACGEGRSAKRSGVGVVNVEHNRHHPHPPATRAPSPQGGRKAPGEPWKIGWFGALRCRRSLALLAEFSRRMEGRVEVVLRGRPAYTEFDDFDGFVAAEPYLQFHGAYRNPEDLARIYGEVHFSWAIDFFEAGQNSDWLLPNRLYEGCRYHCVPIAMQGTETSLFLKARGIGFALSKPDAGELVSLFERLDAEQYEREQAKIAAQDARTWICDEGDCRALVGRLRQLVPMRQNAVVEAMA